MAERKKAKTEPKKRKKHWFQIVASRQFNHREIGETTVYSPEDVMGKTASVNLMNLVNDIKKQHINVKFRVNEVKDNTGYTELISYQIVPTHIKRIVRRNTEKLGDSLLIHTKDGKPLRIKPLLVTRAKTKSSVLKALRQKARAYLNHYIRRISYTILVNDLVTSKLQSSMYRYLRKTYPLKTCEIRVMEVASEKKPWEKKKEEEKPKEEVKKEVKEEKPKEKPKEEVKKEAKPQPAKEEVTEKKEPELKEKTEEKAESKPESKPRETQTKEQEVPEKKVQEEQKPKVENKPEQKSS